MTTPLIKYYKNLLEEVNKEKYQEYSTKEYDRKARAKKIRKELLKLKFRWLKLKKRIYCA